jgi:AcrR family transcriptional regulator
VTPEESIVRKPQDARERILDAAEQLFAENGFDATPTSKVAKRAAVPKGLLFYYFPTKRELLKTLVGERLDLGPIDTASLIEKDNPVRSLLNLTSRLDELQRASDVLRVIIWREQHTHPEIGAKLSEHRGQLQSMIERVLRASAVGPVSAARFRAAAQAWLAIVTMRPGTEAAHESATTLAALAELVCDGLRATPT